MCDLTPQETHTLVEALADISALTDQTNMHARSITETAYMDHENLSALLASLRDKADTVRQRVAGKPHEHAGHMAH